MTESRTGSGIIEHLVHALSAFDEVDVRDDHSGSGLDVCIDPQNSDGFCIYVGFDGEEFTVTTDFWHGHYHDVEDAVDLCVRMLTDEMRQKKIMRGDTVTSVVLQFRDDQRWVNGPRMVQIFGPFWKIKRTEYNRNNVLTVEEADAVISDVLSSHTRG